jgi:AraC-like DNA-binding protein
MIFGQHLILQELTLPPATEQCPPFDGWLMARVAEGVVYWLQPDSPAGPLASGDVFVAAGPSKGRLRASQLEPLRLQFFTVHPRQLEGLLTVVEWHRIEGARLQAEVPVHFFKSTDAVSQKFARLASLSHPEKLPLRCALLQLWAAATADWPALNPFPADDGNKLRGRFWQLLSLMTRMELCCLSPAEIASRINCGERHFRCLFRKEFGVSVQGYQTALRLAYVGQPPETAARKTAPAPCVRRRRPARRFAFPKGKSDLGQASAKPRKAGDSAGLVVPSEGNAAAKTVGLAPG